MRKESENVTEEPEETPLPEEVQESAAAEAEPAETAKAEPAAAENAEENASEAPQPTESDKLAEALAAAEDYKRKWYAVTAEYENYRRRTANESAKKYTEGRADVVSKLFPIGDNLDRALKSCESEATRRGIELVVKAFEKILSEEHIEVIDPLGEAFDAEQHEAIMAVEAADGGESGTVRQVYAKGYRQNGKVLRFAQVVVVK